MAILLLVGRNIRRFRSGRNSLAEFYLAIIDLNLVVARRRFAAM
jgi:hypothetical protein